MALALVDEGELLPELLLPELFKRLRTAGVAEGGDFNSEVGRPIGVGELIRCKGLFAGSNFCVDFEDDN